MCKTLDVFVSVTATARSVAAARRREKELCYHSPHLCGVMLPADTGRVVSQE